MLTALGGPESRIDSIGRNWNLKNTISARSVAGTGDFCQSVLMTGKCTLYIRPYDWKTHYILDEWWGLAREEKSCDECKRKLGRVYAPPCPPLRVSNISLSGIAICRHQVKRLLHSNLKKHLTGKDCLQGWSEYRRTLPPRCTIMLRTVYRCFSLVRANQEKPLTTS